MLFTLLAQRVMYSRYLCREPNRASLELPASASCSHRFTRDVAGEVQEIQGLALCDGAKIVPELSSHTGDNSIVTVSSLNEFEADVQWDKSTIN